MAISKVIYKSSESAQGETWIDATPATAVAADIMSPKTAMLADGVVTQGTGAGGGGGSASGTFSPATNLRSITLSDCVGKKNIAIWPTTSLVVISGARTHYGDMWIDGIGLRMTGSSNSGGTGWSLTGGSTQASWDSTTGTMTILATTSSNYGGYYASGITYGYHAW